MRRKEEINTGLLNLGYFFPLIEKKTKMDQNQQKSTFFLQRLAIAVRFSVSNNRTDRKISEICAIFVSNKVAQGGKNTQKE